MSRVEDERDGESMNFALRKCVLRCVLVMAGTLTMAGALHADDLSNLPDAPGASGQQTGSLTVAPPGTPSVPGTSTEGKQTKRILYIVPNFRSVSANQKLPAQTVGEKFQTTLLDSVDYSSFIFVGLQAGFAQLRNATPEFHQGAAGYGRYYWHTYADYVDENLWTEFILPAALHQDSRYYTLTHGSVRKRLGYSFSRVVITRSDKGHNVFNASEVFGSGTAAGISSTYYPSQERTFKKVGDLWLTNLAIDGGTFVFKEFWPDLNNKFFHQTE